MLFEPGDRVSLMVVRAERVQPGDVYWGIAWAPGKPQKGFVLESEGVPVPEGAVPFLRGTTKVKIANYTVDPDSLVLVELRE